MEPITLATVTAALTVLGNESMKGFASEAGKAIWNRAKTILGWSEEPKTEELPQAIATKLQEDESAAQEIVHLLQTSNHDETSVQMINSLVQNLTAEKVVVAGRVETITF